jgi:NifB/MoaA-like Fe-S oxidoreductase
VSEKLMEKLTNTKINVYTIINNYFGNEITVAGLLTGSDLILQLKEKHLGDCLILPEVLLRSGTDILLDDITVDDMENALQTKIRIVQSDGKSFIDRIINEV